MTGATAEGTKSYFSTPLREGTPPRQWDHLGWWVSRIGFGGYRIEQGNPDHKLALRKALLAGCNCIDTSSNYTDGSSERLIGEVLAELEGEGSLRRDQVVVVTKAGYIQGGNMELALKLEMEQRPFAEVVKLSPQLWHCISPHFLETQLRLSTERMKLHKIDVFLLHNPEYFLKVDSNRDEYYRRIEEAFRYLEEQVDAQRLQVYGISSNTFPESPEAKEFTSLSRVLNIAKSIRSDHHFRVIQFPFNLFETGAVMTHNNDGKSVAELAKAEGIATLINRPLNAFTGKRMIRLADFRVSDAKQAEDELKVALVDAVQIEGTFPGVKDLPPIEPIALGHYLKDNLPRLGDILQWRDLLSYQIRPIFEETARQLSSREDVREWTGHYINSSQRLISAMTRFLEARAAETSNRVAAALLDRGEGDDEMSRTLSQEAIRLYQSLPGIDSVLVGMRKETYVDEVLGISTYYDPNDALKALRRVTNVQS